MKPSKIFANFGKSTLLTISTIFILFNFLSGIVSGIWLLILRDWEYVVMGLIASFAMPFIFSIVSMVTLIVIPLFKYFNKRKNIPMIVICALLNTIYQNFLIVIWVYMVFNTFLSKTTDNNWIPLLIWSYGVAMGPLAYMARGEDKDSIGTNIGIFLAILTWFTLAFMYLFTGISLIPLRILWIGAALFQTYLVTAMQIAENKEQND